MSNAKPSASVQKWLALLVVCGAAVALCAAYVDRPVADFMEVHVRQTGAWPWLNRFLTLFSLGSAIAILSIFAAGCWVVSGRRLAAWALTPLQCAWSTAWGVSCERVLKTIFGRPGPDPLYLHHQRYGFEWLAGNLRWASFPSGTAIVAVAFAAVIWILQPRLRFPAVVIAFIYSAAAILANWHWVSDVIAGAFLGGSIGWMTVHLNRASAAERLQTGRR